MRWAEITVHTAPESTEAVANILIEAGAAGVQLSGDTDSADSATVTAYLPDTSTLQQAVQGIRDRVTGLTGYGLDPGPGLVQVRKVEETDWAESWKAYYHPIPVGRRLLILPSWESPPANDERLHIVLDPGMAFGTGSHPTTLQCLEALQDLVMPGGTVVDIGTGSGILAIAAAHLGAGRVVAVDVDPQAVDIARENCRRNGVDELVQVEVGSVAAAGRISAGSAHLVVANIIAEVLEDLAAPTRSLLSPGGHFLCAGVVAARSEGVVQALGQAGYTLTSRDQRGEWVALLARAAGEV